MHFSLNCPVRDYSYIPDAMSTRYNGASLTGGHVPYKLSLLCEWPTAIPLTSQWVCLILPQNQNYLLNNIIRIGGLEVRGSSPNGESWNILQGVNEVWTPETQYVVGCSYATGFETPGDGFSIEYAGIKDHNRGFARSPIAGGRTDPELLKIAFLETNSSFVDNFIRPWSILASHKGLFAYPFERSIKSTIHMFQLGKTGPYSNPVVRKRVTFFDVVPINVPKDATTSSEATEFDSRPCDFSYNYYTVSDGTDVS